MLADSILPVQTALLRRHMGVRRHFPDKAKFLSNKKIFQEIRMPLAFGVTALLTGMAESYEVSLVSSL